MKHLTIISISILLLIASCTNKKEINMEDVKLEVLNVVKAHNKAWAKDEDINEQMKYAHPEIIMIAPPYDKIIRGIDEYKAGYLDWMKHAKVHSFEEVKPDIKIMGDGTTALVTYKIEMSFDYDSALVDNWHGVDCMTLVKEEGNWKIISDMYAKKQ